MSNRLAAELCRALREGTTGAVEWRDDKRRRLFFFRAGALVLVQSNLKSESPERIAERAPDLPPEALVELVAATRLREALAAQAGEVALHLGVAAPGFEALDLVTLLWEASDRLPTMPADAWPRVVPAVATHLPRLPVGAEVVRYLLELDGSRPLDDVLDFGPTEPEALARALAVAWALGAVTSGEAVAPIVTPSPGSAPPSTAGGAPSTGPQPVTAPPAAIAPATPPASQPTDPPPAASTATASPSATSAPTAPSAAPRPPGPRSDTFSVDDIADGIQFALDQPTGEAPLPRPPAGRPSPGGAGPGGANLAGSGASRPPTTPEAPPASPFGGASATVTLGGGRPSVTTEPDRDELAILERFGTALPRIRGAGDHFAVLGTSWQDGVETHRRAYFALAQRLHPDRFVTDPEAFREVAAELFDRVRAAWEVLGDDERREAYIARVIRGEKSEEERAMEQVRRILEAEGEFKRGVAELNGGRLTSAHEHFARAAAAAPEEIEFGAYAAYTSFRLAHGRDERAAAEAARRVSEALKANDKLDNVWVLHGIVQKTNGNESAARHAFVTALKLKPANPDALRELKRLEREREAAQEPSGFLSKLFKKK